MTDIISALFGAHPGGQRRYAHLSDRALLELVAEGITQLLTGEQRIMEAQNDLAGIEQKIADDIQDISAHFDTMDANLQALKDANSAGDQTAVAAEAAKIEAQLAAFRAKVDANPNAQTPSSSSAETSASGSAGAESSSAPAGTTGSTDASATSAPSGEPAAVTG